NLLGVERVALGARELPRRRGQDEAVLDHLHDLVDDVARADRSKMNAVDRAHRAALTLPFDPLLVLAVLSRRHLPGRDPESARRFGGAPLDAIDTLHLRRELWVAHVGHT